METLFQHLIRGEMGAIESFCGKYGKTRANGGRHYKGIRVKYYHPNKQVTKQVSK
jgi:hypothetical protein